ncbi:hypothetical protein [uncultured Ruegeria sp.]|uniref:hypothetical protein n=1 Tax=uncultured Ruegeria sp. TaxID=259304 RepID=UPI00262C2C42|nr:hypothetical protein [uncultured Ruegeria sp.]
MTPTVLRLKPSFSGLTTKNEEGHANFQPDMNWSAEEAGFDIRKELMAPTTLL